MKKLITILTITLLMSSCSEDMEYSCVKGTIRILNKQKYPCARGGNDCSFYFYLYDGSKAYHCSTDRDTYNSYYINDTLPTLVITKTIKD